MTNEEWLTDHGFHGQGHGMWARDNVGIELGELRGARCRIYGEFGVTAVRADGETAELAMRQAVEALREIHLRALAILEGA